MKITTSILCISLFIFKATCFAQESHPVKQLTFDRTQDGFPTWSPDGKYIVYSCISLEDPPLKTGLWKISLEDNKSEQILNEIAEHPKWSPDGRFIVFDADSGKDMKIIPAEGGNPINFLPDSIEIYNGGMPIWSPDGEQIAFLERSAFSICIYNMETHNIKRVFQEDGMFPFPGSWSPDGESIFIVLMDRHTRKSTIWKIYTGSQKKEQITGHHEGIYRYLALSPDGDLLIYAAIEEKHLGLWVMPAEGGKSLPLAVTHPGHNESPAWSPDGKRLVFTSTRTGNFDIWQMDIDVKQLKHHLQKLNEN